MKNPKISIVLPSYNGEKYIAESIQSVIDQSFNDWELIIVNDCSKDKTLEIANSFAKRDSRIRVISNKVNQKLPGSLNIGFENAKGEYLTWTSDDNMYKENALKKMNDYLDANPNTDMVSMNMDIIDENGYLVEVFSDTFVYKRTVEYLMHGCNVGAAFMYRRTIAEKVGNYDTDTFCAEDYDYWCRIALKGRLDYTNDNIYMYRVQRESLTATKQDLVQEKTLKIKQKYAKQFFDKYSYTEKDKAIIWYRASKKDRPVKYNKYYQLIRLKLFLIRLISLFIFWDKKDRKDFRKNKTNSCVYLYSFSRR